MALVLIHGLAFTIVSFKGVLSHSTSSRIYEIVQFQREEDDGMQYAFERNNLTETSTNH